MDIPEYHLLVVDMADSIAQLSENGDGLMQVERPLAEALPGGDVIRCLTRKLQEAALHRTVVKVLQVTGNVQQIWVVQVANLLGYGPSELLLVLPESA